MRLKIDATLDYDLPDPADVLLQLEAAQMPDQALVEDKLTVTTNTPLTPISGLQGVGRRTWSGGQGNFVARYHAIVDVIRERPDFERLQAVPMQQLPGRCVHFLWGSRYVQPDELREFASEQFGEPGGPAVAAMAEWAQANIQYLPGCSDAATNACDTFNLKKGICRDFAHVMLSFARALDIPARMVSAYAWNLDPPDFHAVVEVYLAHPEHGAGWYLIDPSGLAPAEGIVRIGVGRDATDISFMTVFRGTATLNNQVVTVERLG
jgi:transglutaminase-like putative cysteine protease